MNDLLALDRRLFLLVNRDWTHPALDAVMTAVTNFDLWRIPLIVLLLVLLARSHTDTRVGILLAILAVALTDQVVSSLLKPLFHRVRPFHVVEGTRQLASAYDWSFPSGHAANTFAAGVFLALRFRRARPLLLLPATVAYSRVYVGVHYPSDAVAGAIVGAVIGAGFVVVDRAARVQFGRRARGAASGSGAEAE